jgi:hypothetical protein
MWSGRQCSRAALPARLAVLVVAVCAVFAGCGGSDRMAVHPVAPPPPDSTPAPAADTMTFDLRFKGVGVVSSDTGLLFEDVDCSSSGLPGGGVGSCLIAFFPNETGTPLELSTGSCDPAAIGDCGWQFETFPAPSGVGGLSIGYRPDVLTQLASDLDSAVTDTVIISLDLEPANAVFAVAEYVTTLQGGYTRAHHVVAPSGLQAAASQAGAQGRVITAVSFDSGQVHYVSYGWQHAASAIYEAQVAAATFATIGSAAQSLAASGYFITAVGGDATDGFLLVGTRVKGVTAPRNIQIIPGVPEISGYAIVGFVQDIATQTTTAIAEQ